MISNVGLILAIIVFFVLKFIYNLVIIIFIIAFIARMKAKGQEILKKGVGEENGEKR